MVLHIRRVLEHDKGNPSFRGLSPYLFVMGMEMLSILLRRAMDGGFISSYDVKGEALRD